MNKNTLDITVIVIAFSTGLAISVGHNPLIGVAMMIAILTSWNVAPKLPKLIKAKSRIK